MTAVEKLAARLIDTVLDAVDTAHPETRVEDGSLLMGDDYYVTEDLIAGILGDWMKAQVQSVCDTDVDLPDETKGE